LSNARREPQLRGAGDGSTDGSVIRVLLDERAAGTTLD
jgi:hypothetical protein